MGFATNACLVCHGMNAIGGGAGAGSALLADHLDKDAFRPW